MVSAQPFIETGNEQQSQQEVLPKELDDALKAAKYLYELLSDEESGYSMSQQQPDQKAYEQWWTWVEIHVHKKLLEAQEQSLIQDMQQKYQYHYKYQ